MNEAPISSAERVLQTTLQHVRREKSRRRTRRAIAVGAAIPALAFLITWAAALRTPQAESTTSHVIVHAPEAQDTRTLAVLVVRDGTTIFEQRRANDLADLDLTFSLDPVIAQVR